MVMARRAVCVADECTELLATPNDARKENSDTCFAICGWLFGAVSANGGGGACGCQHSAAE